MASRTIPPLLAGPTWLSDAGLETCLVFLEGLDLPAFAAFPLLEGADGRATLRRYFDGFFAVARRDGRGIVVDTPTWRANRDWGSSLGYEPARLRSLNEAGVSFAREVAAAYPDVASLVNGVVGPRGDGYQAGSRMTATEAGDYHRLQTDAFAAAGADMVSAVTMTYSDEAIGVARASAASELAVVISFTVETDGRLPSGESLGAAIECVDAETDAYAAYYMVNCAHPTHFDHALNSDAPWLERIGAIRANASTMSHAELDEAEELDRGDPDDLATRYAALRSVLANLRVVGGCCGTDVEHVDRISAALRGS